MKRIGNLYGRICDKDILRQAFKEATRGKKNKIYVRPYLERQEYYIDKLHKWLSEKTLILSDNKHKIINEGTNKKTREITVPKFFPDQVVHWAYCIVMRPVFMRGMYRWSCGSVEGRGTLCGVKQARRINNNPKAKYTLKTDFKKYFQSICKSKLMELLEHKIKDKDVLWLSKLILDNGGQGLPIGYFTSQWFANFYLERIDHFVKEELHVPFYIRYVDDMVMWDSNKRRLSNVKRRLDEKLARERYAITIKENWQMWRTNTRPLDFLGYRIKDDKLLLRKKAFFSLMRKVREVKKKGKCNLFSARSILSRLGWLMRCNGGVVYYTKQIKPIISKGEMCKIVSLYSKKIKLQGA